MSLAFPDRLFNDPTPKIEQPQPQPASPQRTPKTDSDPSPQPITKADSQRNLSPGGATLAPTPFKAKLAPDTTTDNQPSSDELAPSQPGSTSKLARATDRSPAGNNQTNLASGTKSPQGFANDSQESNPASRDRKSTRLNSSHRNTSRMPSSA